MLVLEVGSSVDALDLDDIWSPGIITRINDNKALVRYEGWGNEWDEWIALDEDRLVQGGTYTLKAKCWAKLGSSMPWWPSVVTIRLAKSNSESGRTVLQQEPRLFVVPLCFPLKKFSNGLWVHSRNISPYCVNTEYRKRNGVHSRYKHAFSESVEQLENKSVSDIDFTLDGSLMSVVQRREPKRDSASKRGGNGRAAGKISPNEKHTLSNEAVQAVTSGRHLLVKEKLAHELSHENGNPDDGLEGGDESSRYLSQFTKWATSLAQLWETDHPLAKRSIQPSPAAPTKPNKKARRI